MKKFSPHEPDLTHWGHWVLARARFVGIRRQQDMAAEIGCTRERITRWKMMATSPRKMSKGFDAALCRALKTDKETLFTGYAKVAPEAAPIIGPDNDPQKLKDEKMMRDEIRAGAGLLNGEGLRAVAAMVKSLLSAKRD